MKILFASNSPLTGSGYGTQAALFGPLIAKAGHDLAFYANWGVQGTTIMWNGFHIYPADSSWGNRTMPSCAAHHAGELEDCQVIMLVDAWVLRPADWPKGIRVAVWAPVDTDPIPVLVREVLKHERVRPIAMSRFGERQMADAGLDPLYVPHGVDTSVFRPQPERRAEIRDSLNLPHDAFVVGMVAANKGYPSFSRKSFPQVFQAFARFREEHRDAILYLHTNEMVEPSEGMPLRPLAAACGIPRQALRITDALQWELGVSQSEVADFYSAIDTLACPSAGEGFGVPIVEAQACGCPVIVNNWTAMPELLGAGWMTDGDRWWNATLQSWFKIPTVDSIVAALEQAYLARDDQVLRHEAREFALQYDADRVFTEHWLPVLDALEGPREIPPLNVEMAAA